MTDKIYRYESSSETVTTLLFYPAASPLLILPANEIPEDKMLYGFGLQA